MKTASHVFLTLVLAAGAVVARPASRVPQIDPTKVKTVQLAEPSFDFAFDPEVGGLATLVPQADKVIFYPQLGGAAAPVEVKVGRKPIAVVYKRLAKRGLFAVACHDSQELVVLESPSLKVLKVVPLHLPGPSALTTSTNPADPYVYFCGGRGHDSRVGRVNLDTLTNEGTVTVENGRGGARDAVVSADGTLLYLRGPWSPSGFEVAEIEKPSTPSRPPLARSLHYDHRSVPGYVPDRFGQYVAVGQLVYTADLKREAAKLPAEVALFLEGRPLLAGLQNNVLTAISANTFRTVGSLKLPLKAEESPARPGPPPPPAKVLPIPGGQGDFKQFAYKTRLLEWPAGKAMLVCRADTVCLVPLAALDLPAEPFLAVRFDGALETAVGRQHVVQVVPKDPTVKLELTQGPAGLKLDGTKLVWTPGPALTKVPAPKVFTVFAPPFSGLFREPRAVSAYGCNTLVAAGPGVDADRNGRGYAQGRAARVRGQGGDRA